jgi:hypothetical protein
MAKLIAQLAAAGAISAPLMVETGDCVASDVADNGPVEHCLGHLCPVSSHQIAYVRNMSLAPGICLLA